MPDLRDIKLISTKPNSLFANKFKYFFRSVEIFQMQQGDF